MSFWDRLSGNGSKQALQEAQNEIEDLRAEVGIRGDNLGLFEERLAELELHLEDEGWQVLGGQAGMEFSRRGLTIINGLVRLYWLKNPLVRRAILTQTQYVLGKGVNIFAKHPLINEVVQEFLDDRKNKAELTEHQALTIKETELQCFANLFFVFFVNKYNGHVRVRTVPMDQITEILSNPEDAKDVWYYKREWITQGMDASTGQYRMEPFAAYYPDWRFHTTVKPKNIGGVLVHWDEPVYHVSVNRLSDMRFGVSEVYSALDWARAYKEFLENRASTYKALARFAWKLNIGKGGAAGVSSAKAKLESTLATGQETNPSPVVGSTFVSSDAIKLDSMKTAGAVAPAKEGRYFRLMVSSATGIFEHYLTGDPSTGNLATAKTMELPMLIMFRDRQQLWISVLTEILDFVVDQAVKGGRIPGKVERGLYGEEVVTLALDTGNEDEELRKKPINRSVEVEFSNILEDVETRVKAIVAANTLDGKPQAGTMPLELTARLLLEALGVDNIDEILVKMFPPSGEGEEEPPGEGTEKLPDTEEMFISTVRNLNKALVEAMKSGH